MTSPTLQTLLRPARPDEAGLLSDLARRAKASHGYPEAWLELWREDLTVTSQELTVSAQKLSAPSQNLSATPQDLTKTSEEAVTVLAGSETVPVSDAEPREVTAPAQAAESGLPAASGSSRRITLVAESTGVVLGWGAIEHLAEGPATGEIEPLAGKPATWEIVHLWIEPTAQRMGIGRALAEALEVFAEEAGASEVSVVSDPHAAGFYQHLGYAPDGFVPSQPTGRQLPRLRKDLSNKTLPHESLPHQALPQKALPRQAQSAPSPTHSPSSPRQSPPTSNGTLPQPSCSHE